jgi:cytochrome c-type biogenesis protein CcmH/NrfF
MKIKNGLITALMSLVLLIGFAQSAKAAAILADLENALMCKCDDKCGKVLINCTCSTSDKTRAKFSKMLDSGLTVDQIIKMQVDEHGETILSSPTKSGFNLTAWAMPFVALLAGGFGISKVIEVWKKKGTPEDHQAAEDEEDSSLSAKNSSRIQDELDKIES